MIEVRSYELADLEAMAMHPRTLPSSNSTGLTLYIRGYTIVYPRIHMH